MTQSAPPYRPLIWTTLYPANSGGEELRRALAKISEEDPSFTVDNEGVDGQVVIRAMSEAHSDNICEGLARKHKIFVESETPKVIYLKTVLAASVAEGKFIKQLGGKGHYAHVVIRIEPNPDKGLELVNEMPQEAVPGEYVQSIGRGIRRALKPAVAGQEMTDIRIVLCGGSHHDLDSNEGAFESAGFMAMQNAVGQSNHVLMEPVISVQVVVPQSSTRSVIADLRSRRAEIIGMDEHDDKKTIRAIAGLAEMIGYAEKLRSLSGGTGAYSAELLRYRRVDDLPPGEDDGIGVTANTPRKPKPKSGAAVEPPPPR